MKRFKKETYLAEIFPDGTIQAQPDRIKKHCAKWPGKVIRVSLSEPPRSRTLRQNAAFHGTIREQVQKYYQDVEGQYKSLDRIKDELKKDFLIPAPQYYDDGSPVIVEVPHPEKKGVMYKYHLQKVPDTSELTLEEFNDFITSIIDHFWQNCNWSIVIDPKLRSTKSFYQNI